jgi:APA family basic amino acid/polyamine antiporter
MGSGLSLVSCRAGQTGSPPYVGPLVPALAGREALTGSCVIVGFALLQWGGVRIGNVAQQVTSLIKAVALVGLAIVALVLGGGAGEASVVTARPEAVAGGTALFAAVVVALQSAIFTYDGWTGPIYFGEEVRNPGRDVPRAMIGGVLVVLAIYLLLNLAFVRVLSIEEMAGDPFVAATAATRVFGPAGDTVLRVMMIFSLIATVNALQLMASRVPYAMSRDGFLPAVLGRVNVGGTPVPSLLLGTAISVIFVLTNTFETALALIAFFFVANYVLTFTTLFVMRRRAPELDRPFRVPAYPWLPGIVLVGSVGFLVGAVVSDTANSLIALLFLAASWPVYWLLGRRASVR